MLSPARRLCSCFALRGGRSLSKGVQLARSIRQPPRAGGGGVHTRVVPCAAQQRLHSRPSSHSSRLQLGTAPEGMAPPIRCVVFDLDGTLLDTESLATDAMNFVVRKALNMVDAAPDPVTWDVKQGIIGMREPEWSALLVEKFSLQGRLSPQQLVAGWEAYLEARFSSAAALPGAYELVAALTHHRVPIALATSSGDQVVKAKRTKHEELFKQFRVIVTGQDPELLRGKPAPDIFLLAAKRMCVPPEQCLVFEDSPYGVQAGLAAGCQVVAVPDTRMDKSRFEGAHQIIHNLKDFTGKDWGWPQHHASDTKA